MPSSSIPRWTGPQVQAIETRARAGELDLLYMAPERLLNERSLELLDQLQHRAVRHRRGALRVAVGP